LLTGEDARLPEELLSLLLDAPSYENFTDEELARFPSQIRSYLYSWELVFASYPNASYKVRNDYSEVLKSENYISPLLDFLFDVLGHSAGQPLNLDKANFTSEHIRFYDDIYARCDEEERNIQSLLINLYYLCLKFAPGLAKNWWMNCKSKQTRIAVESWTEKYFSPLVIVDALDEVATWASRQEPESEDEKELIVKVSKNSREVCAGREIDDMQMQIVIRLPTAYPLEGVKVDGINRVAVTEKKWQSWLMITQGVITFSVRVLLALYCNLFPIIECPLLTCIWLQNGSIIDGLTTFRRNVTGALKGQTECAICYSIISSDKKMPDKRCQTCKNMFHSSCLFKWFASSNQSTCPLCRNQFHYGTDVASRVRRRGGPE
jgi:E3 ubiquitin-protein ligase listerin